MDTLMGRYRNVSILAAAIFIQILGLAVQVKRATENQSSRLIRIWAVSAITPMEKTIVRTQSGASNIWHNYFYLRGVRQENRQLKDQIQELQLEQVRLQQDANQAHRLQALLGFKEQFIAKTLAAQVIGSSGSEQSRTIYIDKGSRDGIQQDMAVISADGVVGRVISVFKSTSQILLINDQTSGVGAILEQSRVLGVLQGKPSGGLVIDKIMADEDIKAGDKVVTSGGDLIFPKGLLIGTVSKIDKGPEFLQISVKPAARLDRLEEVLVILKKEEREPVAPGLPLRAADILARRLPSVPDKPATPATGAATGAGSRAAVATNAATHPAGSLGTSTPAAQLKAPGVTGLNSKSVTTGTPLANSGTAPVAKSKPANADATASPNINLPTSTPSKPAVDSLPSQPDSSGDAPQ
ncbi:MAG TPA: rod shape-determining protein MreC [Terriglobales bacterium]|nr:rod shape-determining protein MreC [Terriglobales bacterium]